MQRSQINKKQSEISPNQIVALNSPSTKKIKQKINYFIAGPGIEADRALETTLKMHDECSNMITGIRCF